MGWFLRLASTAVGLLGDGERGVTRRALLRAGEMMALDAHGQALRGLTVIQVKFFVCIVHLCFACICFFCLFFFAVFFVLVDCVVFVCFARLCRFVYVFVGVFGAYPRARSCVCVLNFAIFPAN